jgi:[CysO sulfur-carrier protein]-S-L-cysteine hydrolase
MLELPGPVHDQIVAHALRGLPDEACGLLSGGFGGDRVERFHPMRNAASSSQVYVLDGRELLDVEAEVDRTGSALLGVVHSHTHTTAYPSPTDVEDAARFDPFGAWRFVIVSLKHAAPSLRCYRILDGVITEEEVRVSKG